MATYRKPRLERALIIRQPHIGHILDGLKSWEMRSSPTRIRGRIGLIEAGSGMIVGEAELVRVQQAPKTFRARHMTRAYHKISVYRLMDKWCWAWVLENAVRYDNPIPYKHPKGAVIWVSLSESDCDSSTFPRYTLGFPTASSPKESSPAPRQPGH